MICAALTQLTTGGSYPIYHGGLLHTLVRYYDFNQQRPGFPEDVAALIDGIDNNKFRLHLVNYGNRVKVISRLSNCEIHRLIQEV